MSVEYDPEFDVNTELQRVMLVMPLLSSVDLEGYLAVVERAHSLGPFIDPTKYRDQLYRGDMDSMAELCRALIPAVAIYREKIEPKMPAAAV